MREERRRRRKTQWEIAGETINTKASRNEWMNKSIKYEINSAEIFCVKFSLFITLYHEMLSWNDAKSINVIMIVLLLLVCYENVYCCFFLLRKKKPKESALKSNSLSVSFWLFLHKSIKQLKAIDSVTSPPSSLPPFPPHFVNFSKCHEINNEKKICT